MFSGTNGAKVNDRTNISSGENTNTGLETNAKTASEDKRAERQHDRRANRQHSQRAGREGAPQEEYRQNPQEARGLRCHDPQEEGQEARQETETSNRTDKEKIMSSLLW